MSLRINNNIPSVNGHRNMVKNDWMISKSLEKLSSGLRINKAADDAAGLIISEQMRAQLSGLDQAVANSEQAITMIQTAEGAMDEMNSMLKRARSLALHSANSGVNDSNQLTADQSELDAIIGSITRIATNTQFGTKKILDGNVSASRILNTSVATQFSQTGLSVGNVAVNVTTAGVRGASAGAALTSNANAIALTNATTAAGVSGSSTFDNQTTLSILGADQTTTTSVTVAAGTTVTDALAQLNAKNVGITAAIGANGVFTLAADDVGTYANGSRLVIQGGATTDDVGYALNPTNVTNGVLTGGVNVQVNRASDGTAAVITNGALTTGALFLTAAAGTAQNATALATGDTFVAATTLSLVNASGTVLASVVAPADATAGAAAAAGDTTINEALAALSAVSNGKFTVALGTAGTVTITALQNDTASNGVFLRLTAGAITSTSAVTAGGVENTSTGFGSVGLSAAGNRGTTMAGSTATGSQTVSLTLASGIGTTVASYANALKVDTGAVFQIGANRDQTVAVSIQSVKSTDLGLGTSVTGASLDSLTTGAYLTNGRAQEAITVIDKAINDVTNLRGRLGAAQADSLETGLSNLRVTQENLTAAESTIRDVDFAKESASFTKNSILLQSATAMLAQANQLPQAVLKLLG